MQVMADEKRTTKLNTFEVKLWFQLTIADWGSSTPHPTGAGVISPVAELDAAETGCILYMHIV